MADAGLSAASLNFLYDAFAFHVNFLRLVADNQRKLCVLAAVIVIFFLSYLFLRLDFDLSRLPNLLLQFMGPALTALIRALFLMVQCQVSL
jgi:hypothetical protein